MIELQRRSNTVACRSARGLVEQFSDEVCAAFSVAFLQVMREQAEVECVALGMDRRPNSPAMAAACTAATRALFERKAT